MGTSQTVDFPQTNVFVHIITSYILFANDEAKKTISLKLPINLYTLTSNLIRLERSTKIVYM